MITNSETLDMIISCSKAKFCTPQTPLSELGIKPIDAIDSIIRVGSVEDFEFKNDFTLEVIEDDMTVIFSQPIVKFSKPVDEIKTLEDLAEELSYLDGERNAITVIGNPYDLIADIGLGDLLFDSFFTINNSWECSQLNTKKFLGLLKNKYGIQIEKAAINKFYGTLDELCNSLTHRINRAIEFQQN